MLKKFLKISLNPHKDFLNELLSANPNKNTLKDLLESGSVDINHLNPQKETFLHQCLKNNKIDSAIWLINNNISVNKTDKEGKSAFDIAMDHKNHRVVNLILDKTDIDLNQKDLFGRSMLQDMVMLGDHEMAKILLEHGADINSTDNKNRNVMADALSYGNLEFINYLLNFKELDLNNIDTEQNSVLHHPLVKENDNLAMQLIKHGANPNLKDKEGNTFLSNTALRGMEGIEIIETAIKEGFDINARVADENTILIEVISAFSNIGTKDKDRRYSLYLMSKTLVEKGIDIHAVNANNENALFHTVKVNDVEQASILLNAGIEVNLQNNDGETPLALAAYGGIEKLDVLSLLLKYGADPTIMNKNGKTLFEVLNEIVLSNHGKKELIDNDILKYALGGTKFIHVLKEILEHNKRDLNFLDSMGRPLFFTPLLYNSIPLFKLYVKAKLDLHALNKDGQNLFFEYVLKVFEEENLDIDFQSALSMLISSKVNHNTIDETGWTVASKIIGNTTCNIELFKTLVKVVRFDYKLVDKLGRTAIHTAVWSSNISVIKIINYIDKDIKDIPDHYGILPIIYAALLGDKKLVLFFIDIKAKLKTDIPISKAAIKKFSPMIKNIEKLTKDIESEGDKDNIRNIQMVIKQLKANFGSQQS